MIDEPTHEELHEDDNDPATKKDVRDSQEELATMMASSFQKVATKDDLKALAAKDDLKELATKDDFKRVLEIVKDIDKNIRGIPAQVERLNRAVFPHR